MKRRGPGWVKRCALALILLCALWMVVGACYSAKLVTTYLQVSIGNAYADGTLRIVHLSDLHSASFGTDNAELLACVEAQKPDLIFFTGDLVDRQSPDDAVGRAFLIRAQAIAPVYYCVGNHELVRDDTADTLQALAAAGVCVLDNQVVQAELRGMKLTIGGLTTAYALHNLCAQVGRIDLLLCHYPEYFEQFMRAGVPLTFTGHAHGGQARIPGADVGLYAPGQGWFPRWTSGVYTRGGSAMIVSRGLGNSTIPVRIFNPPEVVVVDVTVEGAPSGREDR